MPTDPDRSAIAGIAADERWAHCKDRQAATAPARAGLEAKFAAAVDPDGTMSPELRAKALENYRRAYYRRLALKSAKARRAKKATTAEDAA